uniref:Uncharacterized protein n=1 Tax=Oryza sativa subsp. japonica TaxID=39947 RepID=Q2QW99_ORYSJ|nr:hypothetical protein LOC_Os12g10080 [Oryza sativa Japonica Group]
MTIAAGLEKGDGSRRRGGMEGPTVGAPRGGWTGWCGGLRAKRRAGCGRGRCCGAGGGDGDIGWHSNGAAGAAGVGADETEGEAARATVFRRNSGDAAAWPGKRMVLLCWERQRRRQPTDR